MIIRQSYCAAGLECSGGAGDGGGLDSGVKGGSFEVDGPILAVVGADQTGPTCDRSVRGCQRIGHGHHFALGLVAAGHPGVVCGWPPTSATPPGERLVSSRSTAATVGGPHAQQNSRIVR